MKKIIYMVVTLLLFIPSAALANSISNIDMAIYVDNSGTAHVKETWSTSLDSGTEGYKPYYNIGTSNITNFKVSMNNEEFTYVDSWDTSLNFNDKKYKNGINYLNNGLELCFGISNYGSNTYTLTYDITNFVVNTSDGYQMIYWTLFPYDYNPNPGRVYIKIYSDFRYSDTLDVWGYGKYGAPTYVYDGYIEMDSENTVHSDEYMTILVKFPEGTFNAGTTLDKTIDDYLESANDGAKSYSNKKSFIWELFGYFMEIIFPLIFIVIPILIAANRPKYGTYKMKYGEKGNKIKLNDIPYFRDIPYKKEELSRAYWIACQYNLIKKPTDYLGAILLKWTKMGNVSIQKTERNASNIIFNNCANLDSKETELYNMMYTASKDGILEKNEFTSWCNENYSKIFKWFNDVIDFETEKLVNSNYLVKQSYKKCLVNDIMYDEAVKVAGVKKFLKDFSNIKDRNAIEVNLWEEYLMYAQIFGIADKVIKEFKNLYPDVITQEVYDNYVFIHYVSDSGIKTASTARSRAESYSSGGGGFSSGGGGGGSFGGGGGGGGFR